ncbi:ALP1-like protein [Tanacetum coccineum]
MFSSSDDEDEVSSELAMFTEACQAVYEASKPKVLRNPVERDRYSAHDRLVMAYFSEHPQYDESTFRERFRMSRRLFTKIVREVTDASLFFQQTNDYTGKVGISSLMKCTSTIRQMAYEVVPDSLDEYLQMGATIARDSLRNFCKAIMNLYGEEFLRNSTYTDMEKLYAHHDEKHGFSRMLGSIDYPFILLEAIASKDLWIWHAFFGVSGMNNDVNVLRQSPIFNDLKSRRAPDVPFMANNVPYKRGYYLTDGIYPQWAVPIKSIKNLGTNDYKRLLYKTKHEAARKDVERAFGVLKTKWKVIKYPARGMSRRRLSDVMYTCIILHNMIIHDNGEAISTKYTTQKKKTMAAAAAAAFAHHILLVHSKPSSLAASATDSLLQLGGLQISKQGVYGLLGIPKFTISFKFSLYRNKRDEGFPFPGISGLTELISGPDGRSQMYTPSEFVSVIGDTDVVKDEPTNNVPDLIFTKLGLQLHRSDNHPLGILKNAIYEYFDTNYNNQFQKFDDLCPIVTTKMNFDDVLVPADHVSRSYNDTYYIDADTVLRCHTSAHQANLLREGYDNFLVTGDVYRRDSIDSTHYPVFHQMEGVRVFNPSDWTASGMDGTLYAAQELKACLEGLARHLFGRKLTS